MKRRYRKKSSFESEQEHKEYLAHNNRRRERLSRRRKKRKTEPHVYFPYLLPYWGKWTPQLYRLMSKQLGFSLNRLQKEYQLLKLKNLWDWETVSTWKLSPEIDQRITNFAEMHGFWFHYPFPPKISIILAREARHADTMARFLRVNLGETRWVRTPYQLRDFTYDQIDWIVVGNQKHLRGLEKHPATKRWIKECEDSQGRSVIFNVTLGSKRSLPKV